MLGLFTTPCPRYGTKTNFFKKNFARYNDWISRFNTPCATQSFILQKINNNKLDRYPTHSEFKKPRLDTIAGKRIEMPFKASLINANTSTS
jgi:hypothetical protein